MIIRKFTPADYNPAIALWGEAPGVRLRSHEDSEAEILRFLTRNPNTCFVAEQNGKIIGTILGGHDGRRGFIYHLAVSESSRKQGIGRALAEKTVEALKREDIAKIALFVLHDNEGGNAFWEKLGFKKETAAATRTKRIIE